MNDLIPSDPSQADPSVVALMHGMKAAEGASGNYNAIGDEGTAAGIGQWSNQVNGVPQKLQHSQIPLNFVNDAKQYGLDPNDFSPENQNKVLYAEIAAAKKSGLTPEQILSKHNSGDPNKYINAATSTGTGPVGAYDVADYVKRGMSAAQQYAQANKGNGDLTAPPAPVAPYSDPQGTDQPAPQSDSLPDQINSRLSEAGTALNSAATGRINPVSGLLQTVGAAGGFVGDVTNDALGLIPGVKQGEALLGKGASALANTPIGQHVVGEGQAAAQAHPELAGDIGAVGNILGAVGSFEGAGAAKDAIGGVLGKAVGKDALSPIVEDISPDIGKGTKAGASDVLSNGTQKTGMLGKVSRIPDPQMVEAAPIVKEVAPNFSKLSTYSEKVDAVQSGIEKYANELKDNLSSGDVQPVLTPEDLAGLKASIDKQVAENPFLTGEDGVQAQKIFNQFTKLLPQDRDVTMSDVLEARKKLDSWIKSQKGPGVLDPAKETQVSLGLRAVRQGANNLLAEKAPDADVKELLRKQSLLFKAAENMAPKASKEVGTTSIGRLAKKHPHVSGLLKYSGTAIAGGLGLGEAQHLLGGASSQ